MIFVNYSHRDKDVATMTVSLLEQSGLPCWIDYRDAVPGLDFAASIVKAIKESAMVLLIVSESSMASSSVLNELNSACNAGKTIVPFKLADAALSDAFEYYIGRAHWLEAVTPPIEAHIERLAESIKKLVKPVRQAEQARLPLSSEKHGGCRIALYEELADCGYGSPEAVAMQLVENDYVVCNGIDERNEGSAGQWAAMLARSNETFRYLINHQGEIVGNWSLCALPDDLWKRAKEGSFLEAEITTRTSPRIFAPKTYHGYLLALSILPRYSNLKNSRMLVSSLLEQLAEYASLGVYFDELCINVFSEDIVGIIESLSFSRVASNAVFGTIYVASMGELAMSPLAMTSCPQLASLYGEVSTQG